jgi:hypothetical protein
MLACRIGDASGVLGLAKARSSPFCRIDLIELRAMPRLVSEPSDDVTVSLVPNDYKTGLAMENCGSAASAQAMLDWSA